MKTLEDLLTNIDIIHHENYSSELIISGLTMDSRQVQKGTAFVAIAGIHVDGHEYIEQAISRGAVAVVCTTIPDTIHSDVAYIAVENSAKALGMIAANYYDHPSRHLKVAGVTGTNGKTTVAYLLYQLTQSLGYKSGLISTIDIRIGYDILPSTHTTPDAISIQQTMRQMVDQGCQYCYMEVSSHAIDQHRIQGIEFDAALFTNITHDHLDYHGTFANYLNTKKAFFDHLTSQAVAITNVDDKNGKFMLQNTKATQYTYAMKNMADYRASIMEQYTQGMTLKLDGKEIYTHLSGEFNVYNLLAVYTLARLWFEDEAQVNIAISTLKPVKGRFETLESLKTKILAVIDYAHTPDALEKLLEEAQKLKKASKIITVVGCGGNRDVEKRPIMAQIACRLSDRVILTSDNPRFEDPVEIIQQMKSGLDGEMTKKTLTIVDRLEAIKTSCMLAETKDIIVIAGKGHENYQDIQGVKHEFDDRKIIESLFDELAL